MIEETLATKPEAGVIPLKTNPAKIYHICKTIESPYNNSVSDAVNLTNLSRCLGTDKEDKLTKMTRDCHCGRELDDSGQCKYLEEINTSERDMFRKGFFDTLYILDGKFEEVNRIPYQDLSEKLQNSIKKHKDFGEITSVCYRSGIDAVGDTFFQVWLENDQSISMIPLFAPRLKRELKQIVKDNSSYVSQKKPEFIYNTEMKKLDKLDNQKVRDLEPRKVLRDMKVRKLSSILSKVGKAGFLGSLATYHINEQITNIDIISDISDISTFAFLYLWIANGLFGTIVLGSDPKTHSKKNIKELTNLIAESSAQK